MLSNFKRRIGVLTAVAVLGALVPAFTTSTASAAPATVLISTVAGLSGEATYLTCPLSASIPAAGFTDTTSTDVDCIAYYGITKGTTATTYEPTASVPRWAMALYLTRALSKAGVTLGTGADQGFTDISGKSDEIVTAINQLKQLGVTTGVTDTTYVPDNNVIRQEMALFIERMLDNIAPGPGGTTHAEMATGVVTAYVNSNCGVGVGLTCTGKYNYTDIDAGTVTVEASDAIKELYSLNIHDGLTATTFSPDADMTRAAMASFLVGALNHSNLRPVGLTLQASSYSSIGGNAATLSVTDRDANHVPIAGTPVDVFRHWPTGGEGDRAFATASGLCEDTVADGNAVTKCSIDLSEPQTDLSGNMSPASRTTAILSQDLGYAGTDTWHAWTAATATAFDNDIHSTGDDYSTVNVVANPALVDVNCSIDTATYAKSRATHFSNQKYGATTTITCQGTNLAGTDAYVAVASPSTLITMSMNRAATTRNGVGPSTVVVAASNVAGYTDATGKVTFTIAGPANPLNAGADKDTDTVTLTCATLCATITAGEVPVSGASGHMRQDAEVLTFALEYLDTALAADISTLTQTAATSSVAATTRTVTATSYDQFGDPVAGNAVVFTSVNLLHQGALCTDGTEICTLAGHGLSVGEDVTVVSKVNAVGTDGTTATANGVTYIVRAAASTSTFTLENASGVALNITTAGVAATPMTLSTTSTASASRTTNAAGQATYSWADSEATSAKDTITATPATGATSSVVHYRLATSADFVTVDADGSSSANGDDNFKLARWDNATDTITVEHFDGTVVTHPTVVYKNYTYDANDHFATGAVLATPNGNQVTLAAFEARLTVICAAAPVCTGLVGNDIVYVNGWTGLSTAIVRYSTD